MKRATMQATREAILNWVDKDRTIDLMKASIVIPVNKQKTARSMLKNRYRLDAVLRKMGNAGTK